MKGDALAAWNALNLEGSDILSEREMDFLDDMELDMLAAYVSATEAAEQLEAEKHKARDDAWTKGGSLDTHGACLVKVYFFGECVLICLDNIEGWLWIFTCPRCMFFMSTVSHILSSSRKGLAYTEDAQ